LGLGLGKEFPKHIFFGTCVGRFWSKGQKSSFQTPKNQGLKRQHAYQGHYSKTVEEVTLPEPDDEFAKKLGSQTVEEMKKSIKSLLEKQAEDAFEKDKRTLVDEFLLKEYDFDIPPTLLHSEVASRKDSFIQDPRNKLYFEKMSDKEKNMTINRTVMRSVTFSIPRRV